MKLRVAQCWGGGVESDVRLIHGSVLSADPEVEWVDVSELFA